MADWWSNIVNFFFPPSTPPPTTSSSPPPPYSAQGMVQQWYEASKPQGAKTQIAQQMTQQKTLPSATISVPTQERTTIGAPSFVTDITGFIGGTAQTVQSRIGEIFRPVIQTPQAQAVIGTVKQTVGQVAVVLPQAPATPAESTLSQLSTDIYGGATRVAAVIQSGIGVADIGVQRIERALPGPIGEIYAGTYQLGKGIFLTAPKATVEMAGMIPGGVETLARQPQLAPAFAVSGLQMQAGGLKEGFEQRPLQTFGELIGMAALGKAGEVVRIGEVKIPTAAGEVPIYKGAYLDIGATPRPIIGYTPKAALPVTETAIGFHPEGAILRAVETARTAKPVFGTPTAAEIPVVTDITAGYFPKTALETRVIARPEILTKLGMEPTAFEKISVGRELIGLTAEQKTAFQLTRPATFEFMGKEIQLPWQVKTLAMETESLPAAGVEATLKYLKTEKFDPFKGATPTGEQVAALDRLVSTGKALEARAEMFRPLAGKEYEFKPTMELEVTPGKRTTYYDITESGQQIGTMLIEADKATKSVTIGTFELTEQFRGKGRGTALATTVLEQFKQAGAERIELIPQTPRAGEFWGRLGFEKAGELKMELRAEKIVGEPRYNIEDIMTVTSPVFERMGIKPSAIRKNIEMHFGKMPEEGIMGQTWMTVGEGRGQIAKWEVKIAERQSFKSLIDTVSHEVTHAVAEKGFEPSAFVAEPVAMRGVEVFLGEFAKHYKTQRYHTGDVGGIVGIIHPEYSPYALGTITARAPWKLAIREEYQLGLPTKVKPLVEKVMGSFSAQAQMQPQFRRVAGDIDVHITGTKEQATQLAKGLQFELEKIGIETRVSGSTIETRGISKEWVHAVQFLPKEEIVVGGSGGAGLRYGIKVDQPAMTVEGLPVMRLGEQTTRKITGSLEFREGKLQPAAHRFKKDVRDAFTVAQTLIESKTIRPGVPVIKQLEVARGRALLEEWKKLYPEIDWSKVGTEPIKMEIDIGLGKKATPAEALSKMTEKISEAEPYKLSSAAIESSLPEYVFPKAQEPTYAMEAKIAYTPEGKVYAPTDYTPAFEVPAATLPVYDTTYPREKVPTSFLPAYHSERAPSTAPPVYVPERYAPGIPYVPERTPTYPPEYPTMYPPEYPPEYPPYYPESPSDYPPYVPPRTPPRITVPPPEKPIKWEDFEMIGKRKKKVRRTPRAYTIRNPLSDLEDLLGVVDMEIQKEIGHKKSKSKGRKK